MKLWIDDIRNPPDDSWYWVKTSREALEILAEFPVEEISFDHDLGGDDTSMSVAVHIEQAAYEYENTRMIWHIHSANPVGRKNLESALMSAERYWCRTCVADREWPSLDKRDRVCIHCPRFAGSKT